MPVYQIMIECSTWIMPLVSVLLALHCIASAHGQLFRSNKYTTDTAVYGLIKKYAAPRSVYVLFASHGFVCANVRSQHATIFLQQLAK